MWDRTQLRKPSHASYINVVGYVPGQRRIQITKISHVDRRASYDNLDFEEIRDFG